jgi:FtsP/CotA-like multicopper oxidase with cupredoxin domain
MNRGVRMRTSFLPGAIRRTFLGSAALFTVLAGAVQVAAAGEDVELLDPLSLTKYVDPLPVPGAMPMSGPNAYEIGAWKIQQRLHRDLPLTDVYGYGTTQATASWPAATIVAQRGVPITIRWTNHLPSPHLLEYAFDPTIPAATTKTGIPITTHVHGAEVEPQSDGGPHTWFTPGFAETGSDWTKESLSYSNSQLPATIWYHDHAFGYTRHNVYAGLAGFYVVTDPGNEPANLPSGPYDIGLALQDRMLTADARLWYPDEGVSEIHPVWIPEFFGDLMVVNGKIWPYLEVEPRRYRFRFLNGAQARFFSLSLNDRVSGTGGPAFHQIGTDGGYLAAPVVLNDPASPRSPRLVLGPGERADVIVDFTGLTPGREFLLKNTAKAPFPNGDAINPQTSGQIMLFRVIESSGPDPSTIPAQLTTIEALGNPSRTRIMTLNEMMDEEDEPIGALLNGMGFHDGMVTELPTLGSTEQWDIVNMTGDTHPIHLHLVQFQILDRHKISPRRYQRAFEEVNPFLPLMEYTEVPYEPYLRGRPIPPDDNERGWKDTFRMNPGEVTRVIMRFAPQDGSPAYDFDATAEPGYVWHCHILEHEENDMMRPYKLVAPPPAKAPAIAVEPTAVVPAKTGLRAASPHPLVPGSKLAFHLAGAAPVELDVFDVTGRHVGNLARGTYEAGDHAVDWRSGGLGSGVYFLRFRAPGIEEKRKVIVAR